MVNRLKKLVCISLASLTISACTNDPLLNVVSVGAGLVIGLGVSHATGDLDKAIKAVSQINSPSYTLKQASDVSLSIDRDYPNMTHDASYRNEFRSRISNSSFSTNAYDDEVWSWVKSNLNDDEKILIDREPWSAPGVFLASRIAGGVSGELFRNVPADNSKGNALKHSYWNVLMCKYVGCELAEKWGDAHESGDSAQEESSKNMDWFNNEVGRSLYKSYPNKSEDWYAIRLRNNTTYTYVDRSDLRPSDYSAMWQHQNTGKLVYIDNNNQSTETRDYVYGASISSRVDETKRLLGFL